MAKRIETGGIAADTLGFRSVEGLQNANDEVLRIPTLSAARPGFLRNTEHPVKLISDAVLHLVDNPILPVHIGDNILFLLIVEPFQGIQHRQSHGIVLRHACHVVAEHIEDGIDHKAVVGLLLQLFGKAHVQKGVQACRAGILVCVYIQMTAIGVDGEIVLLSELRFSEPLHADEVAPFAALALHEFLKRIGNRNLSGRQLPDNPVGILQGDDVPGVGDLLPVRREGGSPDTLSKDMSPCLIPFQKLIQ